MKGEAGEVLAPLGKPEIATETKPLKPFTAVIDVLNVEGADPAFIVSDGGETAMLKSGLEVTVRVRDAECDICPEVPVATMV